MESADEGRRTRQLTSRCVMSTENMYLESSSHSMIMDCVTPSLVDSLVSMKKSFCLINTGHTLCWGEVTSVLSVEVSKNGKPPPKQFLL